MRTLTCCNRASALLAMPALCVLVPSSTATTSDVTLAVAGRPNATPGSLRVVRSWWSSGALDHQGKADIFCAVSRDGGGTFGAPVRVNTIAGEARLGGELPPRVALTRAGNGGPQITVTRLGRPRTARRVDGGQRWRRSHQGPAGGRSLTGWSAGSAPRGKGAALALRRGLGEGHLG